MLSLLYFGILSLVQQVDADKILERADKALEEAKASYEEARSKGSVPGYIEAGFRLEEARIKFLVLQEIGSPEKQKLAADRLRAVNQLSKLIHDGKVAIGGSPAEPAPPRPAEPPPVKNAPPPPPDAPASVIPVDVFKRAPVPETAKQKDAEKVIKDLYKDQYSRKTPTDRKALARLLLTQGLKSNDDMVSQWVLFREAQDIAVQGGDAKSATDAIDAAARSFDIDALPMKVQALNAIGKSVKAPEEMSALAAALILLVDDLVRVDLYDAADKAATSAVAFARKGNDQALATRVGVRAKDISEAKTQYQGLKKFLEILAKNPDDGPANAEMGRYLCLVKGSWDLGLRFLVKGADETLKSLSEKEIALPTSSAERMAIADGWFDLGEKEKNLLRKMQLLHHAQGIYESALPDATAILKARMEKRIDAIEFYGALPGQPGGPGSIDLTLVTPKAITVANGKLRANINDEKVLVIAGGKECKKYLFAHAPSSLTFDIPPGCRQFLATGIKLDRNNLAVTGAWKYIVVVDGKVLYESKVLNELKEFEADIAVTLPPGAKEIQLKVDDLADTRGDWSVWAYPRFQR
ncbi:MAG TPA: NPCBM/NEW2 domain-containing protein [Planctomycetota bacterium]|nr:NPCBM/NEW2 domain-containing protein [Planctomycetota bacterium]